MVSWNLSLITANNSYGQCKVMLKATRSGVKFATHVGIEECTVYVLVPQSNINFITLTQCYDVDTELRGDKANSIMQNDYSFESNTTLTCWGLRNGVTCVWQLIALRKCGSHVHKMDIARKLSENLSATEV